MKIPQVIEDTVLGELIYDQERKMYNGTVLIGQSSVSIHISIRKSENITELIDAVSRQVRRIAVEIQQAEAYAAAELVGVKNKDWLEEGESRVVVEEFARRMKLRAITAYGSEGLDLWFAGDGMFWDHDIRVRTDTDGGFLRADLSG